MSTRPDGTWRYDDPQWRRTRRAVLERDGYLCTLRAPGCTGRADQVDHIVPVSHGGDRFDPSNLRASCTRCNASRGAQTRRPQQHRPHRSRTRSKRGEIPACPNPTSDEHRTPDTPCPYCGIPLCQASVRPIPGKE